MAVKKKSKVSAKRKQALADYIEKAREYAMFKDQAKIAADGMALIAPELRELAKKAGLDKTKDKPQVDDQHIVETRFSTGEVYDSDRLYKLLKKRKLDAVVKQCFETKKVTTFKKTEFEALEEAGDIPAKVIEEMEGGDDPIYKVVDLTPSIYVHEVAKAAPAKKTTGRKAKAKK